MIAPLQRVMQPGKVALQRVRAGHFSVTTRSARAVRRSPGWRRQGRAAADPVFTLPAEIGAIADQNKAVIYDSDTMLTIAADTGWGYGQ